MNEFNINKDTNAEEMDAFVKDSWDEYNPESNLDLDALREEAEALAEEKQKEEVEEHDHNELSEPW